MEIYQNPKSNYRFGFIITRHVTSKETNCYWQRCIKCIHKFYPLVKIVIIDDNSNQEFVTKIKIPNVIIVKSQFPGAGELLPYYYYYKFKYFEYAFILHDSVFIHRKINLNEICNSFEALPLWHFDGDQLDSDYRNDFLKYIKNRELLLNKMKNNGLINFNNNNKWFGCFGVQMIISYKFLHKIQEKYAFLNLITKIKTRRDRMCLERIIGCIVSNERKSNRNSLLGNIHLYQKYCKNKFNYTYKHYISDFQKGKLPKFIIKVWTGR
jgi:hypothetical protein